MRSAELTVVNWAPDPSSLLERNRVPDLEAPAGASHVVPVTSQPARQSIARSPIASTLVHQVPVTSQSVPNGPQLPTCAEAWMESYPKLDSVN